MTKRSVAVLTLGLISVLAGAAAAAAVAAAPSRPDVLDPTDGNAGACEYYRHPSGHTWATPLVGRKLLAVLAAYGGLCAVLVAGGLRRNVRRNLVAASVGGLAPAAAAVLLALGMDWDGTDELLVARTLVTNPAGEGIERTIVAARVLRQQPLDVTLPYPASTVRRVEPGAPFGSPFRFDADAPAHKNTIRALTGEGFLPELRIAADLPRRLGVLKVELREGRLWVVNETSASFSQVEVCLGLGPGPPPGRSVLERNRRVEGTVLPGQVRELGPGGNLLTSAFLPCRGIEPGVYELKAVQDQPEPLALTTQPPLPQRTSVTRIVVGRVPEALTR